MDPRPQGGVFHVHIILASFAFCQVIPWESCVDSEAEGEYPGQASGYGHAPVHQADH